MRFAGTGTGSTALAGSVANPASIQVAKSGPEIGVPWQASGRVDRRYRCPFAETFSAKSVEPAGSPS